MISYWNFDILSAHIIDTAAGKIRRDARAKGREIEDGKSG
jgi:hypothetical protein